MGLKEHEDPGAIGSPALTADASCPRNQMLEMPDKCSEKSQTVPKLCPNRAECILSMVS